MRLPPLSDLHRHLDGSLREATLRELAAGLGVEVPDEFRFSRGMGLSAALRCFDLSLAVLQTRAAVRRVADEICADAAGEGVTTLEIRFAPQLHEGASPAAIVDAAAEGVAGRSGLILCGLFGEDPSVLEAQKFRALCASLEEFGAVASLGIRRLRNPSEVFGRLRSARRVTP